jgi:NADPH-dependent glutamate synthase beta subunit-like oxidoreductase/2,4-dienoyl-CoA reductase-like NADH-dependent reductase (Old Yellow Enzyme family)
MYTKNPEVFPFRGLEDFKKELKSSGYDIPVLDDVKGNVSLFKESITIDGKTIPNRFCLQPMEGCDGEEDGSPGPLTFRKYKRFAAGGTGLIWVEATAVTPEARANPRQLMINEGNKEKFKELADEMRKSAVDENGNPIRPFLVLQLTHSGRYSRPNWKPEPMIFHHSPILDPTHNLDASYPLITDEYLDELQEKFVKAAKLAYECGYDAVDVKASHGYLLHEILSAHTRTDSKYGGAFKNRIRFMTEVIAKIKKETPGLLITSRFSIYDNYPYPYGFGMNKDGSIKPDLSEPFELIKVLKGMGVKMLNIAFGNPYYEPYIERPHDYAIQGFKLPEEYPLKTIERMIKLTAEVSKEFPDMTFVSIGYTWLRDLYPNVCAAVLKNNYCQIVGIGRAALANPNYANEIFKTGKIAQENTCITCSSCTQIMRDNGRAGCVIRDTEVYGPIFYEGRLKNEAFVRGMAQECRNCWGAACKADCPAGIDVPRFINTFYDGDVKKAYEIITDKNILAGACAYTCPAEVQCESRCTAKILTKSAVPIHEIQKLIAQEAKKNGWTKVSAGPANGKKVAVIGYGPAGIAASVELVKKGFKVTVFEASSSIGGTATAVIPFERLANQVLEDEVRSFGLEETGLFEVKYNTKIDGNFTIDDVMKQGYNAVFVGAGMCESAKLKFSSKPEGVLSALDFLSEFKKGNFKASENDTAAVIGGGNTAMDTAFSLKKAGVKDVYLIYRRSFKELPAWPGEVEKTLDSGVHFIILNAPLDYIEENGKLKGLKLAHTQLGAPDASGRPTPTILPNSEYVFPVSIVVEATGQRVAPSLIEGLQGVEFEKGRIKVVDGKYATSRDKVFAGGDIVNGGKTVVQAVKEGLEAAKQIAEAI